MTAHRTSCWSSRISRIDNGADAFVGHGPHILRGIEIYKGKPIFDDLGEFFREWEWSCDCNFSPNGDVTQAENVVRGLEGLELTAVRTS